MGDLLLDQRVVSGIGNIYWCEALFLAALHPSTPLGVLDGAALADLVGTASELMRAARLGDPPRDVWWCPACQPLSSPP